MENKNNTVLFSLVFLIIGLFGGWLIASNSNTSRNLPMSHVMPNGQMMSNESPSMNQMMMDMNAGLTGKTGDAFDQAFLTEMIVHHQGAVEMAQLALTNAKHQEIKDLASAIITAQNTEISSMKGWLKSWYNK